MDPLLLRYAGWGHIEEAMLVLFTFALGCTGPSTDDSGTTGSSGDTGTAGGACDDAGSFVGSGEGTLTVTDAAEFCVLGFTTVPALADLARITVVPGTYRWPGADGTARYRLPACVADVSGTTSKLAVGEIERVTTGDNVRTTYVQPFTLDGRERTVELDVFAFGTAPPPPALDGLMEHQGVDGSTAQALSICEEAAGCVSLSPCGTPQAGADPESLTFERGALSLHIDVVQDGGIWIDPPRLLYRVSGTLDGTSFEQTDYYRLGYRYASHGLDRELLVLFDTPIGAACGVWGRYGRKGKEELHTIDCDGTRLEDLGAVVAPRG